MAMKRGLAAGTPPRVAWATVAGLVLVFLGERVFSATGWLRETLTGVGAIAVLTLTGLRWIATRTTEGERRSIERALAALSTGAVVAILVYLTTADPFDSRLGITKLASDARNRYEAAATVTWIALVIASVLPMLFGERALFPMRRAARVEWRRVRDAMSAGMTLALAAVYAALFCFAAGGLDVKADFSLVHVAAPRAPTSSAWWRSSPSSTRSATRSARTSGTSERVRRTST
jgi:cytochrome bd-type quinol oxidase subunit 2